MRVTPRDPKLSLLVVHPHTGRRPRPHSLSRWLDRTNAVGARRSALANFFPQTFASPPRPMPLQVDHVPESPEAEQLPLPSRRAGRRGSTRRPGCPPRGRILRRAPSHRPERNVHRSRHMAREVLGARPDVDNRRRVARFDVCEKVRWLDVHWGIMTDSAAGSWGLGAGNAGLGTRGWGWGMGTHPRDQVQGRPQFLSPARAPSLQPLPPAPSPQ